MVLSNIERFKKATGDPTAATGRKIQQVLTKTRSEFSEQEQKRLNSTASAPARFYGAAKIHKLKNDRAVDEIPIPPIISNINTASYQFAKYLAKILSRLSISESTVKSTKEFIIHIKGQNISNDFKLISFDVILLFTKVPFHFKIDFILKVIYDQNEVNTNICK